MSTVTNAQLSNSAGAIATGTSPKNRNLLSVKFFNTSTTADQTITLYHYPSGGSATDTTTVDEKAIGPREVYVLPKDQLVVLGNGDVFAGKSTDAATVTVTVNYIDRGTDNN
jgi:calcineurin-like phosphoesterase family protein